MDFLTEFSMEQEQYLEFEKPIAELESKIEGLRRLSATEDGVNIAEEISRLQKKVEKQAEQLYSKLTPWQKTQVARHPNRPHCLDYINALITDFELLAGDRLFGEDEAIVGGVGRFQGYSVVVIGQEKGHDIETRLKHSFGMAKPEGYRKAIRLMKLADRFGLPIITFVDTAGAFPGLEGEERGQAEAIASCIDASFGVRVPVISVVIGEGGSGGAIAIATANRILMLENSIYSVISPEGCAGILWRDGQQAQKAADALHLTARDLKALNVIDEIIPEAEGAAHRAPAETIAAVGDAVFKHLSELIKLDRDKVKQDRADKFMKMTRLQEA